MKTKGLLNRALLGKLVTVSANRGVLNIWSDTERKIFLPKM
jgi:hypothetical protein